MFNYSKISQSGTFPVGFSDHNVVFCTRKLVRDPINCSKIVNFRSMKSYSEELLNERIKNMNWDCVLSCTDTNRAWENFNTIMNTNIESLAPMKQCKIKIRTEPWVSSEIIDVLGERDKCLHAFHKTKDPCVYQAFCKLRNKAQRLVKTAKANYISEQIEMNKKNNKGLWSALKNLGGNKSKPNEPIVLDINGQLCHDPRAVAEHINSYFVNVAQNLVDNLPRLSDMYSAFSDHCKSFYRRLSLQPGSYKLKCVSNNFVVNELKALNVSKSTGLDNIGPKFLHDGAESLSHIVTHLINLSICNGIVPECTKKAVVTPLYKKNSKLCAGNYRPVSVLTSMSKILERSLHLQVEHFVNKTIYCTLCSLVSEAIILLIHV